MSNTFDKLSVLDSFIEEVNSYLPEIESNLENLAQSPSGPTPGYMDAIEETYRRTHTIGGSASMMDFPGLAHVAHGMEDILGDVLDGVATLDAPTIGLLQRSLGRMHQLLQGIHNGIDEEAVMAEDDADYVRYRALTESSASAPLVANNGANGASLPPTTIPSPVDVPAVSSMPSLDEVLASFRTTPVSADEDVMWPEESAPAEPGPADFIHEPEQVAELAQPETSSVPEPANLSALEMLAATTVTWPAFHQNNTENNPAELPAAPPLNESVSLPASDTEGITDPKQPSLIAQSVPAPVPADLTLPAVFDEMHEETHSLAVQASSLREMLKQLRMAMSVIEAQRTEFKGFLDGSKDALDRMEDWAGQAMGLNLRNSPEHVRRYLPLSVMWVSNTKLKKVLDLLTQITSGVEMTDEQIHNALQQLFASIESCGNAFQQLQAQDSSHIFTHDQGWSPWEMRVSREAEAMRERVTFERRSDLASLRAEIEAAVREEFRREQEAKIREEIRREYETRPLTLAARSELERQLRNEIRQEFEAKRQLQERVSGTDGSESHQELENRLRSEIEIQVRQDFLNQITEGAGDILRRSLLHLPRQRYRYSLNLLPRSH
ncbi:MAG: hypothetical protein E6I91_13190 [Chloroflexi bacterium]|nr:MAG: hypothetical protein E6I91_13190 [Chloroflexota bacterium]